MHIDYEHNAWHIGSIKNLGFLALIDPPPHWKGKVHERFSRSDLVQVPLFVLHFPPPSLASLSLSKLQFLDQGLIRAHNQSLSLAHRDHCLP